jgi:hypothetical protein
MIKLIIIKNIDKKSKATLVYLTNSRPWITLEERKREKIKSSRFNSLMSKNEIKKNKKD